MSERFPEIEKALNESEVRKYRAEYLDGSKDWVEIKELIDQVAKGESSAWIDGVQPTDTGLARALQTAELTMVPGRSDIALVVAKGLVLGAMRMGADLDPSLIQ